VTHYATVAQLEDAVGGPAEFSEWREVSQERINQFADATGDHQWIHIDPERAANGPFGTTIAHGFLTLSMISEMLMGITTLEGVGMIINYGLERVRFLGVVPVGSRIRASTQLTAVAKASQGLRVSTTVTMELEGSDKPAMIAESIALFVIAA
jgi:acyl dehydratase